MRLEIVLEKLEELFRNWGLEKDDWILIANYALKLQGYLYKLRKGHFNTMVNKDKLPWDVKEGYEIFPPKNSEWTKKLSLWIKSTGFETDLIAYSSQELKKYIKYTILYRLTANRVIRLLTMEGNLKILDDYLVHCNEKEVGKEKGIYLLKEIENMCKAARKKGDIENVSLSSKILKKYEYLRKKEKYFKKKDKEFKGIVAYKGKVIGKVMIIPGKGEKIRKAIRGKILVTKMTSPKFTAITDKIKAIITDDGGRLCHAAILAREFKIPCIIGTKIATKILKDGDLVEVDANEGIVKILEKAK